MLNARDKRQISYFTRQSRYHNAENGFMAATPLSMKPDKFQCFFNSLKIQGSKTGRE
jgi:hypothetical protein